MFKMIKNADLDYLSHLIDETVNLRNSFEYCRISSDNVEVSFLSPVKKPFTGYLQGPYEMLMREQCGMKERKTVSSACRNYLRLSKSRNGDILEIVSCKKGVIDCIHQGLIESGRHFLFPFTADGVHYPAYSYVTVYNGDHISEEYAVNNTQILYRRYIPRCNENSFDFFFINFVKDGACPVLEEYSGIITSDPLSFTENHYDNWINHCIEK